MYITCFWRFQKCWSIAGIGNWGSFAISWLQAFLQCSWNGNRIGIWYGLPIFEINKFGAITTFFKAYVNCTPNPPVINSEIVEKAVFNYSIIDHILIFFITRFFGAWILFFLSDYSSCHPWATFYPINTSLSCSIVHYLLYIMNHTI